MWKPILGTRSADNDSEPVYYSSQTAPNMHTKITGKSGTGKTTAALSLILQSVYSGRTTVLFNMHNSLDRTNMHPSIREEYEKHVKVIAVDAEHPLHLPLLGESSTAHSPTDTIRRVNKLCSILTKVGNLEPAQTTRLFQAIEAVSYTTDTTKSFANAGIKTIGEHLQAQGTATSDNAYSKLRTLFTYNLIHDGNCFEKAGELYEIDLNGLFSEEQLFVSKFLIEFLLDEIASMKFRSSGGLTLYLDEAQEYDYKKGSTLFQLLSEARKADTIMILSGTSFGKNASITDQCHFRLCFQETERNNINEILQNYDLRTQAVLRASLRNLPRGKFIAHGDFCEEDAAEPSIISHDETLFTYFPMYINKADNNHLA